jgi:hypothetical protein
MLRLALASGLAAMALAVVATVDHRHKLDVEMAAQVDAWYCAHGRPAFCTGFDEVVYEERWENRELGYRLAFFALGAAAVGLGATGLVRRREQHA